MLVSIACSMHLVVIFATSSSALSQPLISKGKRPIIASRNSSIELNSETSKDEVSSTNLSKAFCLLIACCRCCSNPSTTAAFAVIFCLIALGNLTTKSSNRSFICLYTCCWCFRISRSLILSAPFFM